MKYTVKVLIDKDCTFQEEDFLFCSLELEAENENSAHDMALEIVKEDYPSACLAVTTFSHSG